MAMLNGVAAAAHCKVPAKKFYAWVKAGEIPVFVDPISGRKRYSEESLDAWMAGFKKLGARS